LGLLQFETIFRIRLFKSSILGMLSLFQEHVARERMKRMENIENHKDHTHTLDTRRLNVRGMPRSTFFFCSPGHQVLPQHNRNHKVLRISGQGFTAGGNENAHKQQQNLFVTV